MAKYEFTLWPSEKNKPSQGGQYHRLHRYYGLSEQERRASDRFHRGCLLIFVVSAVVYVVGLAAMPLIASWLG